MSSPAFFAAANVFSTTAVESGRIRQAPGGGRAQNLSINDLDPGSIAAPPNITEPETCLAMMKLGVVPEDLVKLSKAAISKIPGNFDLQQKVANELEQRRLETIERIKDERNKLMQTSTAPNERVDNSNRPSENPNRLSENAHKRIEKLKRKQIASLIKEQVQRRQIMESDINSQQRVEEQKARRVQELLLRREQEEEKSKILSERAKKVGAQKESVAQSIIEKQQLDEARRRAMQEEIQRRNEEMKQLSNAQRIAKLEQIRAAQRQHEMEEIEKAEKAIQSTQEKQQKIDQRKHDYLMKLKEQQKENELKYQLKMKKIAEKEEEQRRIREEKIKKQMEVTQSVIQMEQEMKINELNQRRIREQQRLEAVRQKRTSSSDGQIEELQKEILQKQMRAEENLRAISYNRKQRFLEANAQIKQRSLSALASKKQHEELLANKALSSLQKQSEVQQRIIEMKEQNRLQMQEKAAQTFLKQKIGEDKARRLARMRQYETMMQAQKTKQKLERIAEMKRRQREEQAREQMEIRKHEMHEMNELERLKKIIQENPNIDPIVLAQQFNVDLADLPAAATQSAPVTMPPSQPNKSPVAAGKVAKGKTEEAQQVKTKKKPEQNQTKEEGEQLKKENEET